MSIELHTQADIEAAFVASANLVEELRPTYEGYRYDFDTAGRIAEIDTAIEECITAVTAINGGGSGWPEPPAGTMIFSGYSWFENEKVINTVSQPDSRKVARSEVRFKLRLNAINLSNTMCGVDNQEVTVTASTQAPACRLTLTSAEQIQVYEHTGVTTNTFTVGTYAVNDVVEFILTTTGWEVLLNEVSIASQGTISGTNYLDPAVSGNGFIALGSGASLIDCIYARETII